MNQATFQRKWGGRPADALGATAARVALNPSDFLRRVWPLKPTRGGRIGQTRSARALLTLPRAPSRGLTSHSTSPRSLKWDDLTPSPFPVREGETERAHACPLESHLSSTGEMGPLTPTPSLLGNGQHDECTSAKVAPPSLPGKGARRLGPTRLYAISPSPNAAIRARRGRPSR